ncbi:MAG: carboxypeptidase M32 [Oscillospiraceae bacterium]|nr:carboxypeptidase M32 [Oscillospiraceae bacterium]
MTTTEALSTYREKISQLHALNHAMGALSYDGSTAAPVEAAEGRGKTLSYLSNCSYEIETSKELAEAADWLNAHKDELTPQDRREIEVFLRQKEYTASIPQEEYVAYTELLNTADAVWHQAKQDNDFPAFAPLVKEIFETNRRFARYYKPDQDPYDTQLGLFERGLTQEKTDAFFEALKARIVPLLKKVMAKPQVDDSFLRDKTFPVEIQRKFSDLLMELIRIDRNRCSIGETEHPFTTSFNKKDVRITTHYFDDNVISSMYSVIHEGGHALYELHSGDELEGTVLSGGVSTSIHESQSRFMENYVGRSRAFIELILPKMQALFPEQLAGITVEQMYRAVNKAEPSLIRTEADELTYALHILVRYEIEKEFFAGNITAEDLPRVWNEKYRAYLGVEVPDDRRGVLQDSHWSGGAVGYFPSYALGSAYGAQMLAKMRQTVDVEAAIRSGDLSPINDWLEDHVWRWGGLYDPVELLERAVGEAFDPKYFTDYLEEKFGAIYGC